MRFPVWQFKDGALLGGLEEVLVALNAGNPLDDIGRILFFRFKSRLPRRGTAVGSPARRGCERGFAGGRGVCQLVATSIAKELRRSAIKMKSLFRSSRMNIPLELGGK